MNCPRIEHGRTIMLSAICIMHFRALYFERTRAGAIMPGRRMIEKYRGNTFNEAVFKS